MKRFWFVLLLISVSVLPADAQIPIVDIIKKGIKKVIIAVDLRVQRLQNKTIALQNAQKALENAMSKLHLDEIRDIVEKQRQLYDDYFNELRKVKNAVSYFGSIKDILKINQQLVREYSDAWKVFKLDKNLTAAELEYMRNVYAGILREGSLVIDRVTKMGIDDFLQLPDAARIENIADIRQHSVELLAALRKFSQENRLLAIQRSVELNEISYVQKLYGL